MRLAFVSDWEDAAFTYRRHCWMTSGRRGVWESLQATRSTLLADYVVVHQGLPAHRYHLIPPWKTVWLRHEPSYIAPNWPWSPWPPRLARPAFTQSFAEGSVPMVATWWINMEYDTLSALKPPQKTKALSCIVSGKTNHAGHRTRLAFIEAMTSRYPDLIDVFGRDLEEVSLGPAYKGRLDRDTGFPLFRRCKYDGMRDYRYSLCIENGRERNYYTEKIVDAWLSWTVPIYYGCPNLTDYYPREAFIEIDITAPGAAEDVIRHSREPVSQTTMQAIAEARNLALNRYSTWGTVRNLLARGALGVHEP